MWNFMLAQQYVDPLVGSDPAMLWIFGGLVLAIALVLAVGVVAFLLIPSLAADDPGPIVPESPRR